jgi:hypothetical protein
MTYLTSQAKKQMDLMNKIWQQQTFENLRHSMAKEEGLFTHLKKITKGN